MAIVRTNGMADLGFANPYRQACSWWLRRRAFLADAGRFQATPLMVDGTLFVSTPFGRVIALDPERGVERWAFDPRIDLEGGYGDFANRGVRPGSIRAGPPASRAGAASSSRRSTPA